MREARRSCEGWVAAAERSGIVDGRLVVGGCRGLDGVDEPGTDGYFAAGLSKFSCVGGEVGDDCE